MKASSPQQLLLGLQPEKPASLESFIVSDVNRQLMQHLLKHESSPTDGLTYLWGPSGCGRTHLLEALCHTQSQRDGTSILLPFDELVVLSPDLLDGLENLDLVCLDDIDRIAGNQPWEQALFRFYNRVRESCTRVVMTASSPVSELAIALPDLVSRLQAVVSFQIHELRDSDRRQLLETRAALSGIELRSQVIDYILHRHDRQTGALVKLLDALDRLSLEEKRPVTIPLVKRIMDE